MCRELAAEATKLGGHPWLLSFSGMAEVLGWPERPPLVAESDRSRVLTSWAPYCEGVLPCQRFIPFAAVRQLSPEDFVRALALNMKVRPRDAVCFSAKKSLSLHAAFLEGDIKA